MPAYRVPFTVPQVRDDMSRVIQRVLQLSALTAQREAQQAAYEFKDTATLARSITSDITGTTARVWSPLTYAAVMEQGRRPGAKMPPPAALAGWARRHGFQTDPGSLFVLARAIGRRGIAGRFYFRRAAEALQRQLPSIIAQALREA
jgi:hypothetical protein